MNKLLSFALLLTIATQVHALTLINNSAVIKNVKLWAVTNEATPEYFLAMNMLANQAFECEIPEQARSITATVEWTVSDTQHSATFELVPANYEGVEYINDDFLLLMHQPTENDAVQIKLIGPKLGLVLQQKMLEIALKINDSQEDDAATDQPETEQN